MKKFIVTLLLASVLVGCAKLPATDIIYDEVVDMETQVEESVGENNIYDTEGNIVSEQTSGDESVSDNSTGVVVVVIEEKAPEVTVVEEKTTDEVVAEMKALFKMEDIISNSEYDLRAEPTVSLNDLSELSVTRDDLDICVYNRLITITGTTIGKFMSTFHDNVWMDIDKMRIEEFIQPYHSVTFNFVFPDSSDNSIVIKGVNTTNEIAAIKDLPIYSVLVNYTVEPETIGIRRVTDNKIMGITNGYFTDMVTDDTYDYMMVRVMPTQRRALEVLPLYMTEQAISTESKDYEFNSNYIQLFGNTVDFNKAKLADYIMAFDTRKDIELPDFYMGVDYTQGYCYTCPAPYKCYASGFAVMNMWQNEAEREARDESLNGIYVNTVNVKVKPDKVNIWTLPISNVYTNIFIEGSYPEDTMNIGGLTVCSTDNLLEWYNSTESARLNNIEESVFKEFDGTVSIYADGVMDEEFLSYYPENTGYHWEYQIKPASGTETMFNVSLRKHDLEPYIQGGARR